jgi:small subunit ribosomal protein S4
MSRYLGPIYKKSRRLGFSLLETGEELALKPKKGSAPVTVKMRRRKISEYCKQLQEKQKLRFMYGVSEKQFRRFFLIAVSNKKVVTGLALLHLLESRLDNVVYRAGLARTRAGARQLVNHGHILVNGSKVDIASYLLKPGDKFEVNEKSRSLKVIKESIEIIQGKTPYIEFDVTKLSGKFERYPDRSELNIAVSENLIVEYYNRSI